MATLQFQQDIWNFCDLESCLETYTLPIICTELATNQYYTLSYEVVAVQYFDNVIGEIRFPEDDNRFFSASSQSIRREPSVLLIGVKTAIIKAYLKNDSGQALAHNTTLVRCTKCHDKYRSDFSVKLILDDINKSGDKLLPNCDLPINLVALAENLVPGRKYRYSFSSAPSTGVHFSNASGELFASSETEQNFNTLVSIISANTSPVFYVSFNLTDLSTNVSKRTPLYVFSCGNTCGVLPESIDINLDTETVDNALSSSRVFTISFKDIQNSNDIDLSDAALTISNVRYNGVLQQNRLLDIQKINKSSVGINLLDNSPILSHNHNITFYLKVIKPGFMHTGQNLVLADKSNRTIEINLLNNSGMPTSVSHATVTTTTNNIGEITNSVVLTCEPTQLKPETCDIIVPSGTVLRSKTGTVLNGDITFRAIHFGVSDEKALKIFPGGFNMSNYLDNNYNLVSDNAVFYTYALFSIEATDQFGNVAYTMSKSATVTLELNSQIQSNIIPLWSMDTDIGIWTQENPVTYDNSLVDMSINRLSVWNLGIKSTDVCTTLSLPFPSTVLTNYLEEIDETGLYIKKTPFLAGDGSGVNIIKSNPGQRSINIVRFAKKYGNLTNSSTFSFYLTRENAIANTNSIGSISYTNYTSGTTKCECGTMDCTDNTVTPTPTPTITVTSSITPTITRTSTPTPTSTSTSTPTPTPTMTQTPLPLGVSSN